MKRATLLLSLIGLVLIIVAAVLVVGSTSCTTAASGTASCAPSASGSSVLSLAFYAIGALLSVVGWILGIIRTAVLRRWGWLVEVVLLGTLGSLIYGAFGPNHPKA